MVVLVFWMGLFPTYFLSKTKGSVDYFTAHRTQYHLTVYNQTPKAVAQK